MHRLTSTCLLLPALACTTTPTTDAAEERSAAAQPDTAAAHAPEGFQPTADGTFVHRSRLGVRATLGPDGARIARGGRPITVATTAYSDRSLAMPTADLARCAPIAPEAVDCPEGVELDHGPLSEWWTATGLALRHGWTLHEPSDDALVTLSVDVVGAAVESVDEDRLGATWTQPDGTTWRYTGLAAWDADGIDLPAHLEATETGLVVHIDTAGATWPVTVDPALAVEERVEAAVLHASAEFGYSTAFVPDLNGDGYDELVVGARLDDPSGVRAGSAYLYFGSASGVDLGSEQVFIPSDGAASDYFGWSVSTGDFDGDGLHDLVVGAPFTDNGTAYVYAGTTTGFSSSSEQILAATDGAASDFFGRSVAGVGDVDGDGYDDLIVGANGDDDGASSSGSAYLFYGSSTGIMATSETKLTASDPSSVALFGQAVAGTGDVDGDGYADVAIGAEGADTTGAVYLYRGSASGLDTSSEQKLTASDGSAFDDYGGAVSSAGDIDNDGHLDLLVGARSEGSGGSAYLYLGSTTGIVAATEQKLESPTSLGSASFGNAVAAAGDLDGDGYGDAIVGAKDAEDTSWRDAPGAAVVYFGTTSGLDTTSPTTLRPSDGENDDEFGNSVAGAADLNGDGVADVVVGTSPRVGSGAAYVYYGDCASGDTDGDGFCAPYDCDDTDPTVYPGASEGVGDSVDQDCDGTELCYADADEDGHTDGAIILSADGDCTDAGEATATTPADDCDDDDPATYPGATEVVGDATDQDCDGTELCYADADDDGYTDGTSTVSSADIDCTGLGEGTDTDPTGECDDTDATVNPGATEVAGDGVDTDCDGTEVCLADADDDGHTDGTTTVVSTDTDCTDSGEGTDTDPIGDCDDTDDTIHAGATDVVGDGIDQDCDGQETCFLDLDEDGYTDGSSVLRSADTDCDDLGEASSLAPSGDCNDLAADVHPGATEQPGDHRDQDCDGLELCFADVDRDGYTDGTTVSSIDADCTDPGEAAETAPTGDCDDTTADVHPTATERPGDGIDADCDGAELCFADDDDDGYPDVLRTVASADTDCDDPGEGATTDPGGECDDTDPAIHPGADETVGDGIDADCDGTERCFADADGDGFSDGSTTLGSSDADCTDPGEATATTPVGDCADADPSRNPGAPELPGDGVDSDCDGTEVCYADADDDGHPDLSTTVPSDDSDCLDAGEGLATAAATDCDDTDPATYPGAGDLGGDGIDQDCDGIDATAAPDEDATADKGGCSTTGSGPSGALVPALLGLLGLIRRRQARA